MVAQPTYFAIFLNSVDYFRIGWDVGRGDSLGFFETFLPFVWLTLLHLLLLLLRLMALDSI